MSKRTLLLFLLALVVVCGILLARSCQRTALGVPDTATQPAMGSDNPGATDAAGTAAAARALAISKRRDEGMYAAVSTLHRYLAALPGDDRAKADGFWAGKAPPSDSGEADLRSLKDLRALRIENGTPKSLDSEDVPNALEIPVTLRASRKGQALQHYRGWYRLRRAVADDSWEITSASIEPVAR